MKKLLLIIALQIPILVFAQNTFTLTGQFENLKENKDIYLIHVAGQKEVLDTAKVINGKFEFNVALTNPSIALLILDHTGQDLQSKDQQKDIYRFFITPGKGTLKAKDSIANAQISGLPIFKEHQALIATSLPIENKLIALNNQFNALPDNKKSDSEVAKGFQDKYDALLDDRKAAIAEFIAQNPNSFVSLFALNGDLATDDMNVEQVTKAFDVLSDDLKANPLAMSLSSKLDLAKRTGLGAFAADFEEKTAEQISIKLSSFKGQYVLLDFWASWCGPCRQENPNVLAAYEAFKDKNFTVLGVSIDESEDKWIKAVKQDGLLWTQLLDRTQKIAINYGINAIPKNFLINPEGKIIAKNLRGAELMEKLKEVIKDKK
jgi:peroxiredoxin